MQLNRQMILLWTTFCVPTAPKEEFDLCSVGKWYLALPWINLVSFSDSANFIDPYTLVSQLQSSYMPTCFHSFGVCETPATSRIYVDPFHFISSRENYFYH